MELIQFPEQTLIIAKNQPQYRPMPAHVDSSVPEQLLTCCWQLSWRERFAIFFGGKIWHQVYLWGQSLQPQLLLLKKPIMKSAAEQLRSIKESIPQTPAKSNRGRDFIGANK